MYDHNCSILLAEFNLSSLIFSDQVFIDPTFFGIFVCGPLQSLVVNVCTIWGTIQFRDANIWRVPIKRSRVSQHICLGQNIIIILFVVFGSHSRTACFTWRLTTDFNSSPVEIDLCFSYFDKSRLFPTSGGLIPWNHWSCFKGTVKSYPKLIAAFILRISCYRQPLYFAASESCTASKD